MTTDSDGSTSVSPNLTFPVYAHPSAALPLASRSIADVGQWVNFTEVAVAGAGIFAYTWYGLANATCAGSATATPACYFTAPGNYSVGVMIEDRNTLFSTSPDAVVSVFALPAASAPVPDVASGDVGQSVTFHTSVSGGYGADTFAWIGLPGTCLGERTSTPACILTTAGTFNLQVSASDINGGTSLPSTSTSFVVYPSLSVRAPTVSPDRLALGGSVQVATVVMGGSPSDTFDWSGLPPGCAGTAAVVTCTPTQAGNYWIGVNVTDGNGVVAVSGQANLNVSVAGPSTGGGISPSSLGLYAIVGVGLAVAIALALFVGWRLGKRSAPPPPPRR
jgi:hypothetical protein